MDIPTAQEIARALSRIRRRDAYLDTVRVYVNKFISTEQYDYILARCDTCIPIGQMPEQPMYRAGLSLNRPQPEVFSYLEEQFPRHRVTRADVGLDLVCDVDDLAVVRSWVEKVLMVDHARRQTRHREKGTLYYAAKTAKRNLTIYSDLRSRIDGESSVVHIEWRTLSGRMLRSVGLSTLKELQEISLYDFCKDALDLREFRLDTASLQSIGRLVLGKTRRRSLILPRFGHYAYDKFARVGGLHMRARMYNQTDSAHDLARSFGARGRALLHRIDNDFLLPNSFPINGREAKYARVQHD